MKSKGRYQLMDFTFFIPLRVDSMVRLENMLMSINYLLRHFDTNIIVLQATDYENGIVPKVLNKKVKYVFIEDKDPVFYRTKYLNQMTRRCNTPLAGIWDTDVIIPNVQIIDAVQKLREGYDVAYPYDGNFYDTTEIIREQFWKTQKLQTLTNNLPKMKLIYGNKMKGGAMFVNRKAYIAAGMENEKFYGWGPEDFERYERWKIFNFKIYESSGNLFHLTHGRGGNSTFRSKEQETKTSRELYTIRMSSIEEICQ